MWVKVSLHVPTPRHWKLGLVLTDQTYSYEADTEDTKYRHGSGDGLPVEELDCLWGSKTGIRGP